MIKPAASPYRSLITCPDAHLRGKHKHTFDFVGIAKIRKAWKQHNYLFITIRFREKMISNHSLGFFGFISCYTGNCLPFDTPSTTQSWR